MKNLILIMICALMLNGCAAVNTFEQIQDVYIEATSDQPREIQMNLPSDAGMTVLAGEHSRLYFCQGYEIAVETYAGGDLSNTIKNVTGYQREDISVFELQTADGIRRYEFVWTAISDEGEVVGRAVIMDDGMFHYCVSLTALSEDAGSLQASWNEFMRSVNV